MDNTPGHDIVFPAGGSSIDGRLDPDAVIGRFRSFQQRASGAFAANTLKAIASDWSIWSSWCNLHGRPIITLDVDQFCDFLRDCAQTRAASSVSRIASSIRHIHRAADVADPGSCDAATLTLKAIRRARRRTPGQAAPLTADLVDQMIAAQDETPIGLRNQALALCMRDMLARRSEITDLDVEDFHPRDGLVHLRRSKTDQDGEGTWIHLTPETTLAISAWLDALRLASGPLFRPLSSAGRARDTSNDGRLMGDDISRILKGMASRAGLTPSDFGPSASRAPRKVSGHSLRTGMSVELVKSGASLGALMNAGRWKSARMPAHYAATASPDQGAVAQWFRERSQDRAKASESGGAHDEREECDSQERDSRPDRDIQERLGAGPQSAG